MQHIGGPVYGGPRARVNAPSNPGGALHRIRRSGELQPHTFCASGGGVVIRYLTSL